MRTRTKNFFEDIFLLFILAVIIFFIYFFFFLDNEQPQMVENKAFQEKIEERPINEPIVNQPEVIENQISQEESKENQPSQEMTKENPNVIQDSKPEPIVAPSNQDQETEQPLIKKEDKATEIKEEPKVQLENNNIQTSKNNEIAITEEVGKVEDKPLETQIQDIQTNENENKDENEVITVDQFFKNFEKKVYENIDKNVDKSTLRSGQFVNIRITFLQNGGYEQLLFVSGNMGYFNLIKSSIEEAFPVVINDSIKSHFPRYYRMKIEF